MSKAFTKEDDDAGFALEPASVSRSLPGGVFYITPAGARAAAAHADPAVRAALARAEVLPTEPPPVLAAIGVAVTVEADDEPPKVHRLVSAEEYALVGAGTSVASPVGRALLGAAVGETREIVTPRGARAVTVLALARES